MKNRLVEEIRRGGVVFDGAMGTSIHQRDLDVQGRLLRLRELHGQFSSRRARM
jgi:methionine synthase I (cobalamin-dependent)